MKSTLTSLLTKLEKFFTSLNNQPPIWPPVGWGFLVLILFFIVFVGWTAFVPLESAVLAPGKVIVDSQTKKIQHLEGGIVKEIYIKNGSHVKKGDRLVELDPTQAQARLAILSNQLYRLLAIEARLIAESTDKKEISWPKKLLEQSSDAEVQKNMQAQQAIFESFQKNIEQNLAILQERIGQIEKQIEAYKAQAVSADKQAQYIQEELTSVKYLVDRKIVEKPRLLALQREQARLKGNYEEQLGLIASSKIKIGEIQQQIISIQEQAKQESLDLLDKGQKELTDVLQQYVAALDVSKRTLITSPVTGTVMDLSIHHIGAVVSPAEAIMTLVAEDDKLVVEARVKPEDIDAVRTGLKVKIKLTAYRQRTLPPLLGEVSLVSPDSNLDTATQESFYKVIVVIPKKELENFPLVKLYPGMPAQVSIITERRSAWRYFIQPLLDSFDRAFKEE